MNPDVYFVGRREPPSPRKLAVVDLIVRGFTNKEIAVELGISSATVRNHIAAMSKQTGARHRVDLAVLAIVNGWVLVGLQDTPTGITNDR
jgi:DNA-binding NarL/FixJ family response regulator